MAGYFKIWRELFDKPIWLQSTPEQKTILFTILKMVNWKEKKWEWKGKPYHCKPGEFITSYDKIANAGGKGITRQNVRTALKRFEKLEFLTYLSTHGWVDGIKVTVLNWEKYQEETNRPSNTLLTDYQQTSNTLLTPIEEYKNIRSKEDKKIFTTKKNENFSKKTDPYINPTKTFFIEEYEKVFKKRPFLYSQDCNRLCELAADYEDIRELIPQALEKLSKIKFEGIDFKPTASWLLKGNNFERVMNGEFDNESTRKNEFWERMEREYEEEKRKRDLEHENI